MWVTGLEDGRISSRIVTGSVVSQFIIPPDSWDEELIHHAFLPYEVDAIMITSIHSASQADTHFWKHEKKGSYSVKIGYKSYWRIE